MKFEIFSVYDSKAETFGTPMFFGAKGQAIRAFDDQANSGPESVIFNHPGDFTLFQIGVFDSDTGEIIPSSPHSLGTGVEYKRD
jgi:hypothetical protein